MRDSVRFRLLVWLLLPLAAVLLLGALVAYLVALSVASRAFDAGLLNSASALAKRVQEEGGQIVLDLPPQAQQVLQTDRYDRILFQVRGPGERIVAGNPDLLPPPARPTESAPVFYDSHVGGEQVRVVALRVPGGLDGHVVQVAETRIKRESMTRHVLLSMMVPLAALAVISVGLVWLSLGRGLAPLHRLRTEIAARSRRDLRPIPSQQAPAEVRLVVESLNSLLEQLRDALTAQRRFVADAAHQLRTPLAALQTQLELALQESDAERRQHALEQLQAATRRTARLAHQLLSLARAEPSAGRPESFQLLKLNELVREYADSWVNRALACGLDLGFELEPAAMAADGILVRELLGNLVDNAIRYTPAPGRITVRTRTASEASVVLEVENTGATIPESERERVFERFYRLQGSTGDGCGLGLAIVREIANVHGARVSLAAPASGSGTLVTVRFPRAH